MISCYVIGELHTVEFLSTRINDYPLTQIEGYALQRPENFDAVYSVRPNIVFVDVAFLHGSNNWLARIRQFSAIVSISENTEMAFAAFKYAVFDYLTRPVTFNRFVQSINKFDCLTQLAYSLQGLRRQHVINLRGDKRHKLLIGNTCRKTFFEKKAQKMIRIKSEVHTFSYSRLAPVLIAFRGLLLKIQTIVEINIQL